MARIIAPALLLLVAGLARADTFYLNDGRKLTGRVLEEKGGRISILVGEGRVTAEVSFGAQEVARRTSDEPQRAEPAPRAASRPAARKTEADETGTEDKKHRRRAFRIRPLPGYGHYFHHPYLYHYPAYGYGYGYGSYYYGYAPVFYAYPPVVWVTPGRVAIPRFKSAKSSGYDPLIPYGGHPGERLNYNYYRYGPPIVRLSFKGLQWRRGLLPPVSGR